MKKPRMNFAFPMRRLLEREREFQNRVLAALETPKRGRVAKLINSPFFLWLLSAILITVGGSYLTKHQECMADAHRIADRFVRVDQEVQARLTVIAQTAHTAVRTEADDLAKFKEEIARTPWVNEAFKSVSLQELMEERDRLVRRIDYSSISSEIDRHKKQYFEAIKAAEEIMGMDEVIRYDQAFRENSLDLLSEDSDFAGFKLFVFTIGSSAITNPISAETPLPNCTLRVVVGYVLGVQQPVLTIKPGYQGRAESPFLTTPRAAPH